MDELEAGLAYPQQFDDSALWQMHEHLDRLISSISAFSGLTMENMTRGNGWLFLDIGRRLERSLQLISTMRTVFRFIVVMGNKRS